MKKQKKLIVVKIGSSVLQDENGGLDYAGVQSKLMAGEMAMANKIPAYRWQMFATGLSFLLKILGKYDKVFI